MLHILYISVLYCPLFSFLFYPYEFYPLFYKLQNQNPKKPILLNFVLWDFVGLFFCSLRTIFGTNIFGAIAGDEYESLLSLGFSSYNWFWEVDLNQQILEDYISPNISQWLLKELEQEVDLESPLQLGVLDPEQILKTARKIKKPQSSLALCNPDQLDLSSPFLF